MQKWNSPEMVRIGSYDLKIGSGTHKKYFFRLQTAFYFLPNFSFRSALMDSGDRQDFENLAENRNSLNISKIRLGGC